MGIYKYSRKYATFLKTLLLLLALICVCVILHEQALLPAGGAKGKVKGSLSFCYCILV